MRGFFCVSNIISKTSLANLPDRVPSEIRSINSPRLSQLTGELVISIDNLLRALNNSPVIQLTDIFGSLPTVTFSKYSAYFLSEKRISPWRFNFNKSHQEELQHMKQLHKKVFIIFVCYEDGFTCLSWQELKKLLDDNLEDGEWVHIKTMRKEKYTVTGSDGKLKYKIGKNEFPEKITKNL